MTPFHAWTQSGALSTAQGWSEQAQLALLWGEQAKPLMPRWETLFRAMSRLGPLHIVTTNRVGALGVYAPLQWAHGDRDGFRLATTGLDIDIDTREVGAVYATGTARPRVLPRAVRLFDRHGDALLTLALGPGGPAAAFDELVARNARPAAPPLPPARNPSAEQALSDRPTLDDTLRGMLFDDWRALRDPRAFETILKRHRLNRFEAYRNAPDDLATALPARDINQLLKWLVDESAPMAFQVGRTGCRVIARTIPDEAVVSRDGIELAGGTAVLRLDPRRLQHAYVVRFRTELGVHRSIEFLDEHGELAVCVGGADHDAAASLSEWTREPFRPGLR